MKVLQLIELPRINLCIEVNAIAHRLLPAVAFSTIN